VPMDKLHKGVFISARCLLHKGSFIHLTL